ncbi:hypothetical protein L6164_014088 [Bauhinia variegata]|uniref:Uncharacterized protein n=1 Tax=Bauhinia variegata TaxID=167791 RepID=A0ACB9NGH0_BAUVA|nr:hypothetical protein L6164_014088 [Bauhinia variegata]
MCNKGIPCLSNSENLIDHRQYLMDGPTATRTSTNGSALGSAPGSNDESRRVKFLCSFLGSIMPRPQDGKLRYVGGETRIVSVPRDINYEELMSKMRELYEGATMLKYQQPDEDLDALVSVVNDDDVVNMMEEYDKLGSGDGFTRLRIFLFSHFDQDGSSHFIEGQGDEGDTERRYVDALNNLNDASDFRKQQQLEFSMINAVEDIHVADQYFNPVSVDGVLHSQRSGEISISQYNLHNITIPHMSGQHQQPMTQRYNEMDAPWSPAYYSPRHHGHHDSRSLAEFPSSPSAARYRVPFTDLPDKGIDGVPEDYVRHQVHHHHVFDNQPQYSENVVWLPTGAAPSEKSGFPGNILHGQNVIDGNSVCEHCRINFQRSQPHLDHPSINNGLPSIANQCGESPPNRDSFMMNADAKLHPLIYPNEQHNDHRTVYNDTQNHERGWVLPPLVDEARVQASVSGRASDNYVVDGHGVNFPRVHGNVADGHHVSSNYVQRTGPELGGEVFHDQNMGTETHLQIPPPEERSVRYGNPTSPYGVDSQYPLPHGHVSRHAFWRNTPAPVHLGPSYEPSSAPQPGNGMVNAAGFIRREGSPRLYIGADSRNPWVDSSKKMSGHDGPAIPDYPYAHALKLKVKDPCQEIQHPVTVDTVHPPHDKLNIRTHMEPVQLSESSFNTVHNKEVSRNNTHVDDSMRLHSRCLLGEEKEAENVDKVENPNSQSISYSEKNKIAKNDHEAPVPVESINSSSKPSTEQDAKEPANEDLSAPQGSKVSVNNFSFLPELIASVKRAALEGAEEHVNSKMLDSKTKEEAANELQPEDAHGDTEMGSDNENVDTSKIEPTKAEAEAIARGLQTIKNDDLEEIRELGSGTYGAVYHGKWKGSDVAIKRIKASCFAGRPSERERLIADFWKEALILSSLHHPNVVSFYGIVRDGPDGSLATVTEFMINGSLKQFLHKKDRTIDRRKRVIISMDAAFGMEYLHGKNIVHFDLKCENLLVNMRDPQRPVCKIGDLGLSKVKQHTLVSGGVRGTLPWMAPELLSGKSNMVSEKIDVYSFGIVMWELLTGEEPYADLHCASIIGGIVNNTLRPQIPTWCDPEWKSLMESCWSSDPAERPSFSEISKKLRSMAAAMNVK